VKRFLLAVAACAALASPSLGDEVLFKNGDRLTGKIKSVADGKLTMTTAVAGDVSIDMAQVQTFKTDVPVELHLSDGSVIKQQVNTSPDEGKITTVGGATVGPQTVPVASVQKINPPPVKWTGSIAAGALLTRGNTHTDNVSVTMDAMRRAETDRITLRAGYLFGQQEDTETGDRITTIDNWFAFAKYDYFLSRQLYLYGSERLERDRIALLDLRSTTSVGLGYQWWESAKSNFSTEIGGAWVYEDYRNADSDDHFAARLAYHYDRRLNERVGLFHNLEYLPNVEDFKDFNLNADLGIRADLTGTLFTEFKVEWKYDETPAPGAERDDLRFIVGVGWRF
jgi:putative salt-induced outer membrane protein YdiY